MTIFQRLRRQILRVTVGGAIAMAGIQAASAQDTGPRLGTYQIVLVQLTSGTVTSLLVLKSGGTYEIYEMPAQSLRSSGTYRYDAAQRRVVWLSGLNHEMGRGGGFKIEDGGQVHRIMLGSKVYAINGR